MSLPEESRIGSIVMSKLGLKALALLLGIMAWYLIQDAIRIESVQRQATLTPKAVKPVPVKGMKLERLPITVLTPAGVWEWRVNPAQATVWLEGTEAELDRIEKSAVRLFVDGTVLTRAGESVMLPVKAHLPGHAQVKVQADPMLVEVTVKAAVKGGP